MAIRMSIFEKAGVAGHWDQAADDDLSLTTAVKDIGLEVHFVPQCLVATDGDSSIAEIFEWTNRQLILTKVYYPKLWGPSRRPGGNHGFLADCYDCRFCLLSGLPRHVHGPGPGRRFDPHPPRSRLPYSRQTPLAAGLDR